MKGTRPAGWPGATEAPRRYLSDPSARKHELIRAAQEYVARRTDKEVEWLYRKPYDSNPGNSVFFYETFQVLNLLKAMEIRSAGRVLEVGSGPGWITEILMMLGFEVDAIEPSEDMIAIARDRIAGAVKHFKVADPKRVEFHSITLEEFVLDDESFDGILFHEALHHVIDERAGLERCFKLLRPGGVVGICEWAWKPGDEQLEADLSAEMERFGTLESPFTQEYLDHLLEECGFCRIERYLSVNGFFPLSMGDQPLDEAAEAPPESTNFLTARKPPSESPDSLDLEARTEARLEILATRFDPPSREIHLRARLRNSGETVWLNDGLRAGSITVALRSEDLVGDQFVEAVSRKNLPKRIEPGVEIEMELPFRLPENHQDFEWVLDLVNEGGYWLSERGTVPARVRLPG